MLITELEFRKNLDNPTDREHNIIFLGMSGSGKTYWSKKLSKSFGLKHIEVDKFIARSEDFKNLIRKFPGKDETEKCGNYFGKPWDKKFQSKEDKYLDIEKKIMSKNYPPLELFWT